MLFNNKKPKNHGTQLPAYRPASDQVAVACKPSRMPAQSLIDASLTITGDLRSDGDVQVDGHICGNICCAQLIVGRDAAITGAIMAEEAVVRGRITGTIRAMRVILQDTARVESEITYDMLAIDEGARFEGAARCRPNPYEDAVSSMAELQQMMVEAEKTHGAVDGGENQATSKAGNEVVSSPGLATEIRRGEIPPVPVSGQAAQPARTVAAPSPRHPVPVAGRATGQS